MTKYNYHTKPARYHCMATTTMDGQPYWVGQIILANSADEARREMEIRLLVYYGHCVEKEQQYWEISIVDLDKPNYRGDAQEEK